MQLQLDRPEDRRRDGTDRPAWTDVVPAGLRSEAFAEDLLPAAPGAVDATSTAAPRRPRALAPRVSHAWGAAMALLHG